MLNLEYGKNQKKIQEVNENPGSNRRGVEERTWVLPLCLGKGI
jgi:hypothetical protein